jgi:hypothetical protein
LLDLCELHLQSICDMRIIASNPGLYAIQQRTYLIFCVVRM